MQRLLLTLCAAGAITLLPACVPRVVVVDKGSDVLRLGPDVKGTAYRQMPDGTWVKAGKVRFPEGWYAGPGP